MYLGRFGYVVVEACLYVELQSSLVSNFSNSRADARAAMTGQQQLPQLIAWHIEVYARLCRLMAYQPT